MTNGISLDGKRALVTGGASGIGAVTAGVLRGLGASVAISDINADGLAAVSADLGDCPTFVCDVADESQAESTVSAAAQALG
ncbi:MAG: SDR family NAD(P)-dependent oxidoreductase, partial [Rhodospirillaceae bacterium]|nr:SDR family NAD(P)-dependent oxidoreductase [Rhodospirillaceae bacterium]